jgi:hypothetical protein
VLAKCLSAEAVRSSRPTYSINPLKLLTRTGSQIRKLTAEQLDAYMRFRARREGQGYELSPEFYYDHLAIGVREYL